MTRRRILLSLAFVVLVPTLLLISFKAIERYYLIRGATRSIASYHRLGEPIEPQDF